VSGEKHQNRRIVFQERSGKDSGLFAPGESMEKPHRTDSDPTPHTPASEKKATGLGMAILLLLSVDRIHGDHVKDA